MKLKPQLQIKSEGSKLIGAMMTWLWVGVGCGASYGGRKGRI
jgi:hypothetical protein